MDNICKICQCIVTEDSHYYKDHKITIAKYYEKYFEKVDFYTGEKIKFKDKDSYFLTDFNHKKNLKSYLESIPKESAIRYLEFWLKKRKDIKNLTFAPSEFEAKSLMFPSISYIDKFFGHDVYKQVCEKLGLQIKFDYSKINYEKRLLNSEFVCDTREQNILPFPNMKLEKLNFGDYTIEDSNVFIERKSLNDFVGTLSSGFERFKREIERCQEANSYLVILIENKYNDLLSFEYLPQMRYSRATSKFILHRARELLNMFPLTIQFLAVNGRDEAKRIIPKICEINNNVIFTDLQFFYNKGLL